MATQEVYVGRTRSLVPAVLLSLFTLGLYFLVWYYQLNESLHRHRKKGPEAMILFAFFLLVPVLGWFFALFLTARQVRLAQAATDADTRTSLWIPALWGLVPVVGWTISGALLQAGANRAWERLHTEFEQAEAGPARLTCPQCSHGFETALNPLQATLAVCPQCGRAADL